MRKRNMKYIPKYVFCLTVAAFVLVWSSALAQDIASAVAKKYLYKEPVVEVDITMTMEAAVSAQERFLEITAKELGEQTGYKAGLTNPRVQKALGVSQPVRGTLYREMFLKSGSTVAADFGTRSFSEGDLIVRVGDEAINGAKTPEEALKYLDAVIPCIELPDLVYDKSVKLTGPAIVLINVGARFFIIGEPIKLQPASQWRSRFKEFTLQIFDEKGVLLSEGKGDSLLGDPLGVVLWIRDSLAAEGKKLKKGDMLSLGAVTKMIPAKPGSVIRARYTGLDPKGPVEIWVQYK